MDQASFVASAVAAGAAARSAGALGLAGHADEALREIIAHRCPGLDLRPVEAEPGSVQARASLAASLADCGAHSDRDVVAAACALIGLLSHNAAESVAAIGVDLEGVQAAALSIGGVQSSGPGVRVRDGHFAGPVEIGNVQAGARDPARGEPSNPTSAPVTDTQPGSNGNSTVDFSGVSARDINIYQHAYHTDTGDAGRAGAVALTVRDSGAEPRADKARRKWLAIAAVVVLAVSGAIGGYAVLTRSSPSDAKAAEPGGAALAATHLWPFIVGCTGSTVAMPVGRGDIGDFHSAKADLTPDLVANGAGSWVSGQLAVDLSAAASKSVAVLNIRPHILRRDLAAPAWTYKPDFGCGPNSADRHFEFSLDTPEFTDAGVDIGAAGPSNGAAPTAELGPNFVLSDSQHARVRIDALACRGNYQWTLEIQYTETGKQGTQSIELGPFASYGLGDNTIDYHARFVPSGHAEVTQQSVFNGAAADNPVNKPCTAVESARPTPAPSASAPSSAIGSPPAPEDEAAIRSALTAQIDAFNNADAQQYRSLQCSARVASSPSQSELRGRLSDRGRANYDIVNSITVDGDSAVVDLTYSFAQGSPGHNVVKFVREDGHWKRC